MSHRKISNYNSQSGNSIQPFSSVAKIIKNVSKNILSDIKENISRRNSNNYNAIKNIVYNTDWKKFGNILKEFASHHSNIRRQSSVLESVSCRSIN